MTQEKNRINNILKWLPVIRKIIKLGGSWEQIKGICIPLGLTDTAFRENPVINDYLVSKKYWKNKLDIMKKCPQCNMDLTIANKNDKYFYCNCCEKFVDRLVDEDVATAMEDEKKKRKNK